VDFEPIGRRGEFPGEKSLLDCARSLDVDIVSVCGGAGTCERCKVQVVSGRVSKATPEEAACLSAEELKQGFRLACMTHPLGDVRLHVPPESLSAPQRTQVEGLEVDAAPEPAVRWASARLSAPKLGSPASQDSALWAALGLPVGDIDLHVHQTLSQTLRGLNRDFSAVLRGDEILALGKPSTRWLGLAADIGTTKIAGYLMDLESGRTLVPGV
jgi:uncharacterized 2Fe-2S/4Fe-4S cluster protein (DUF4445 family)